MIVYLIIALVVVSIIAYYLHRESELNKVKHSNALWKLEIKLALEENNKLFEWLAKRTQDGNDTEVQMIKDAIKRNTEKINRKEKSIEVNEKYLAKKRAL
jgi:hypothetical protein